MSAYSRAVAFAVALLLLAGCNAAPEIPFDRTAANPPQSIGIVTPSFPESPRVVLAATVGQSFGLIGALIDAGMQANRESEFRKMLAAQSFSAPDDFMNMLRETLRSQGYTVETIDFKRERADFAVTYPTAREPKVDAYLDLVSGGYGYIAAGIGNSTPYRPIFAMRVRLVSAKDNSVLMQDAVVYNPYGRTTGIVTIAPDPAAQFTTFDQLISNPTASVKALQDAADRTAVTIAQLMQKGP